MAIDMLTTLFFCMIAYFIKKGKRYTLGENFNKQYANRYLTI